MAIAARHGMQMPFSKLTLSEAKTANLEQLAEFLGAIGPGIRIRQRDESEMQWRRILIQAIVREEGSLANGPRERSWDLPRDRV